MDQKTYAYYQNNAEFLVQRYESSKGGISRFFPWAFRKGEKVLEIGSGSGKDLSILLSLGVNAYGIEPAENMLTAASRLHPEVKERLFQGSIPDSIPDLPIKKFDALIISAVLMHIPEEQLFDSAFQIREHIKDRGKLLLSVPLERGDLIPGTSRDQKGRLMIIRPESQIRLLFERLGFRQESRWVSEDSLGRKDVSWLTIIFELQGEKGSTSADKIEGIINRDRKTATYKFALLRAICDLALNEFRSIHWLPGNKAGVPLSSISRKWIEYYWPLFENSAFIPQIRGERPESSKSIAFRKSLAGLIIYYSNAGGLNQFVYDRDYLSITSQAKSHLKKAQKEIEKAIIQGPVYYSGGGNSAFKPFSFDSRSRCIIMDAGLLEEMVQIGHWIRDSIILRWAEITSDFSEKSGNREKISSGEVLPLLLLYPGLKRDVLLVKRIFSSKKVIKCVWSDMDVASRFDIDHAIPFSLWHSNALWNLFPVNPQVNSKKRDRLPSRDLLVKRKDAIITVWNSIYHDNSAQNRFLLDTSKISGKEIPQLRKNWENALFSCFQETVETTAVRRNSERWCI